MPHLPAFPFTGRAAVRVRRLLVRHPIVYWIAVVSFAAATAGTVKGHVDALDAERALWGTERTVLVAARDVAAGEPLAVEQRSVPAAIVPTGAADDRLASTEPIARQRVIAGEIVTEADLAPTGVLALAPPGSLVVTVAETPPSGAAVGEHVWLLTDGIVLTDVAVVVELDGELTRVAVPADAAPAASVAAAHGDLVIARAAS